MAKLCPITKTKVLYLDCLECEEKECKNEKSNYETSTDCVHSKEIHESDTETLS